MRHIYYVLAQEMSLTHRGKFINVQKWDYKVKCQYSNSTLPLGRVGESYSLYTYVLLDSFTKRKYIY